MKLKSPNAMKPPKGTSKIEKIPKTKIKPIKMGKGRKLKKVQKPPKGE